MPEAPVLLVRLGIEVETMVFGKAQVVQNIIVSKTNLQGVVFFLVHLHSGCALSTSAILSFCRFSIIIKVPTSAIMGVKLLNRGEKEICREVLISQSSFFLNGRKRFSIQTAPDPVDSAPHSIPQQKVACALGAVFPEPLQVTGEVGAVLSIVMVFPSTSMRWLCGHWKLPLTTSFSRLALFQKPQNKIGTNIFLSSLGPVSQTTC